MAAPGLDAPGDHGLEIAGRAAVDHAALRHHRRGVDAELAPLLGDHAAGARHDRPAFALDHQADDERLAVGHEPLVALLGKAGALQQLLRGLRIGLPPAAAERLGDLVGAARDLLAQRRPQAVGDLLADGRVVRLDLALAGIDLEVLQPALERRVVDVRRRAGGRHADRRDGRGAAVRRHRHRLDVDQQRQRPAHVAVLEHLVLGVEHDGRQGRIGMGVGEALEPAVRRLGLLGEREHALGRDVVDDVELVVHLGDDALVRRAGIDVGDVLRARLAEARDGRALPVRPLLPDEPLAVGVVGIERIGAQGDRRVVGELQRIAGLLEDVLGHHPHGVPAHREQGVEARVGLLQLEDDGAVVGRRHVGDVDLHRRAPAQAVGLHVRLDGVEHVGRAELDAVAPEDALAQLHRHLGEVGVVDRLLRGERVVPHAIDALLRVDVPEGVHAELVQAGRLAAGIDRPDVEPAGVLDRPLGVLDDQRFLARQVGDRVLRLGLAGQASEADQHRDATPRPHVSPRSEPSVWAVLFVEATLASLRWAVKRATLLLACHF